MDARIFLVMSDDGLTSDQIAEFREAFNMFDRKGKGSIDVEGFRAMMNTLGLQLTEKELLELIKVILDFFYFLVGNGCRWIG